MLYVVADAKAPVKARIADPANVLTNNRVDGRLSIVALDRFIPTPIS